MTKKPTKPVPLSKVKSKTLKLLLENYPEELRDKILIEPDKVRLIERHLDDSRTFGLKQRLPMVCQGPECPFASICVYEKAGIAPVGYGCPEEKIVIDQLVPALVRDLQVDPEDVVELDMIAEYIDAELQEMRAQKELAIRGQIEESVSTVDPATGVAYYEKKESPSLSVKERAQRRKEALRKSFLATREMRRKYKVDEEKDKSKHEAELRKRYEEIIKSNPNIIEEANIVGEDENAKLQEDSATTIRGGEA